MFAILPRAHKSEKEQNIFAEFLPSKKELSIMAALFLNF